MEVRYDRNMPLKVGYLGWMYVSQSFEDACVPFSHFLPNNISQDLNKSYTNK